MLRLAEYVSSEEIKDLCQTSDAWGWYRVSINYALISLAFSLFIITPNLLTLLLGSWLMGGRILGVAVLAHDASHGSLFRSAKLNKIVGRWLLGGFVFVDFDEFKASHLAHHQLAGTVQDPDRLFVQGYPATPNSMLRKLLRDVTGVNGVKELLYQIKTSNWQKRLRNLVIHSVALSLLIAFQAPWAYAIFWLAYLFTYPLLSRMRIMGEHGNVSDSLKLDPRLNTRTTYANFLEKLMLAPNQVNYHLEHHIHQNIPAHNLAKAHRLFKDRGMYLDFDCIEQNYWAVLKRNISKSHGKSNLKRHAASSISEV
ncbi:fatty acid desaturase family protein [Aliiglaciecola litoralis]|uniref:Fatty acid desaturase family protein n=1 Tax=Aliiglaciecola litoralis TaxID=582857 RepID=A0ABN1LCN9_9ALTE